MKNLPKAIEIARKVRKACEHFASHTTDYDYSGNKDLSCMCGVASWTLARILRNNGIRARVIYGRFDPDGFCDCHCWVRACNRIIDITATQFKVKRKVFVSKVSSRKYEKKRFIDDVNFFSFWGSQKPSDKVVNNILSKVA